MFPVFEKNKTKQAFSTSLHKIGLENNPIYKFVLR